MQRENKQKSDEEQQEPGATLSGEKGEQRRAIEELLDRIWRLPIFDDRSSDDIIGYDEHGLPR